MLVVMTVMTMVSLSPLIDYHDRVSGNWLSQRLVPRTAIRKVHALEERMAELVNQAKGDAYPQHAAESDE